jgi:hypothetical protein
MAIVKYLNPRNDIAFKKIFGTEKNKDILMHFLNDVIEKENKQEITNVTLLNPIQHPEIIGKKQSVVDVLCEEKDGTQTQSYLNYRRLYQMHNLWRMLYFCRWSHF